MALMTIKKRLKPKVKLWSRDWKETQLGILEEETRKCELCDLCNSRKHTVFGSGNPNADYMLIGKMPGEGEDDTGEPFTGNDGALLKSLLIKSGIDPENEIYKTNIVACRPYEGRDPRNAEKKTCQNRLNRQVYLVDPLVIITLGKTAFQAMVGGRASSIDKQHGDLFYVEISGMEMPGKAKAATLVYDSMPVYDPSYILKFDSRDKKGNWGRGGFAHQTFQDLQALVESMKVIQSCYRETSKRYRSERCH